MMKATSSKALFARVFGVPLPILAMWGCALSSSASLAETVILADSAADALYFRNAEDGPGNANLLSGNVSIRARHFEWLDSDRAVFAPESSKHLCVVQLSTGHIESIRATDDRTSVVALDSGPGLNEVTVLLHQDGETTDTLRLVHGLKTGPAWDFEEVIDISHDPAAARFSSMDCLSLGDDRFVMLAEGAGDSTLSIVSRAKGESTYSLNSLTPPTSPSWLCRGVGDTWCLLPRGGEFLFFPELYQIYDGSGTLVRTETVTAGYPKDIREVAHMIGNTQDGMMAAVSTLGLIALSDPAVGPTTFTNVLPSHEDGLTSPSLDFSSSHSLMRLGQNWNLYDEDKSLPFLFDEEEGAISPRFVLQRGEGPPFEDVIDVLVTKSGDIYVLDSYNSRVRILRVDRATGDRTVVSDIRRDGHMPFLVEGGNGELIIPITKARHFLAQGFAAGVYHEEVFEPAESGQLLSRKTEPLVFYEPLQDVLTEKDSGRRLLLSHSTGLSRFTEYDEGTGLASLSPAYETTLFSIVGTFVYAGTIEVPDSPDVQSARNIGIRLQHPTFSGHEYKLDFLIRDPDGINHQIQSDFFKSVQNTSWTGYYSEVLVLPEGMKPGSWRVQFDLGTSMPNGTMFQLNPIVAPKAQRFLQTPDGQTWLFESFPPSLIEYDLSSNVELSRLEITSQDLDLDRIEDLAGSIDERHALVSFYDSPRVARINLSTGVVETLVTGRPVEMDEELLGLADEARYRVAVYPGSITGGIGPTGWRLE